MLELLKIQQNFNEYVTAFILFIKYLGGKFKQSLHNLKIIKENSLLLLVLHALFLLMLLYCQLIFEYC